MNRSLATICALLCTGAITGMVFSSAAEAKTTHHRRARVPGTVTVYGVYLQDTNGLLGGMTLQEASRHLRGHYLEVANQIGTPENQTEATDDQTDPSLRPVETLLDIYRNADGKGHQFAVVTGRFWTDGGAAYAAGEINRQNLGTPKRTTIEATTRALPDQSRYVELRLPATTSPLRDDNVQGQDIFAWDTKRASDDPRAHTYIGTEWHQAGWVWPVEVISVDPGREVITFNLSGQFRSRTVTEDPPSRFGLPMTTNPEAVAGIRKLFPGVPEDHLNIMADYGIGRAYVWHSTGEGTVSLTAYKVVQGHDRWVNEGVAWQKTGIPESAMYAAPPDFDGPDAMGFPPQEGYF